MAAEQWCNTAVGFAKVVKTDAMKRLEEEVILSGILSFSFFFHPMFCVQFMKTYSSILNELTK